MNTTWATGSLQLLAHARCHMLLDSDLDRRIAFTAIDNALELTLRAYLRLRGPRQPAELPDQTDDFADLLDRTFAIARDRLHGLDENDLEHYHRVRNQLYHQGTTITVSDEHVATYFELTATFLQRLLNVKPEPEPDYLKTFLAKIKMDLKKAEIQADSDRQAARSRGTVAKRRAGGLAVGRSARAFSDTEEKLLLEYRQRGLGWNEIEERILRRRSALKPGSPDYAFHAAPIARTTLRKRVRALQTGVTRKDISAAEVELAIKLHQTPQSNPDGSAGRALGWDAIAAQISQVRRSSNGKPSISGATIRRAVLRVNRSKLPGTT